MRIYMNQNKDTKQLVDLHRRKVRSRSKSKSKERPQLVSKGKPPRQKQATKKTTANVTQVHKDVLKLNPGLVGHGHLANLLGSQMTNADLSEIAANADNLIQILQTLKQRTQQ